MTFDLKHMGGTYGDGTVAARHAGAIHWLQTENKTQVESPLLGTSWRDLGLYIYPNPISLTCPSCGTRKGWTDMQL